MVPIQQGAELQVSYLGSCSLEPRAKRRAKLQQSKHFACICSRCKEPLETSSDRFLEASRPAATRAD